ncbi:MAG: glycosyltransferase [Crocinitomicaceae bacterium]
MPNQAPHILILSSWYPSEKNPFLGNFVERNAQLLGSKFRVTVINTQCVDGISKNEISTTQKGNITEITAAYPNGSTLSRFGDRSRVFSEALNQLEDIDLIIGHVLLPHGWLFLRALRVLKSPFIWVEHGSYFRRDKKRRWLPRERLLRRRVTAGANAIVAVSETLKKDLERTIRSENIEVIGNHIDETIFNYKAKENTGTTHFLHVSTLDVNTKNPTGIFDACRLLKDKNLPFEMTIISEGDTSEWMSYAIELGIENEISFFEAKRWNEMSEFYHRANAFVLNSEYETFSIVLAEALATGTPIISTKVGIANELPESVIIGVEKTIPTL